MNALTQEQKDFFKSLAESRRARNIQRGVLSVPMERNAIDCFELIFDSWVAAFGKEQATDFLMEAIFEEHHLIRRRLEYKVQEQQRGEIDRKPKRPGSYKGRAQGRRDQRPK